MSSSARSARAARLVPLAAALRLRRRLLRQPRRPSMHDGRRRPRNRHRSRRRHRGPDRNGPGARLLGRHLPGRHRKALPVDRCRRDVLHRRGVRRPSHPAPRQARQRHLPGIAPGPVDLTLTLLDASGTEVGTRRITVTAKTSYPNGPNCGADAAQAAVLVTDAGIAAK
ncbi:hypothetical protein ACU686_05755 [Yinghuangia aomiensis]